MSRTTRHYTDFKFRPLAVAIVASAAGFSPASDAQEPVERRALEEIIVTAQKRAENLQEVPLSVATLSGEKLEAAGVDDLGDLMVHMPSLHFNETGMSTQVRVRGIGSDNSQGFEQSVGMYIDGIYFGRSQLFRTPMMDMQRAELLRGPQGILFGKNSIAGALNLTTAKPTEETEGKISLAQELEYNTTEINGMISGAVTDNSQARLAARYLSADGYMYNSYIDKDQSQKEETSIRLSYAWQPSEKLDLNFKAEHNELETNGRAVEITQDYSLTNGPKYQEYLQILSWPTFESKHDYRRQTDFEELSDNTIDHFTLKADYDLNGNTLTLVSGWLQFDYEGTCDCDFTPAEILHMDLEESYEQFSQEVRLATPKGETIEGLIGAFYQGYDQTFRDLINVPASSLLARMYPVIGETGLDRNFEQSSDTWALFGRLTWNLTEQLHVSLGARYTEETKKATKTMDLVNLSDMTILNDPLIAIYYMGEFRAENNQATLLPNDGPQDTWEPLVHSGHNVHGKRSETAFTPLLNIEYTLNDDMMAYASYTTGFKAGGFDPRSNSVGLFDYRASDFTKDTVGTPPPPAQEPDPLLHFEFEEETATAMEIGMKNSLFGGLAELNFALYRTEYENLQISQFDGAVGFNVGNAEETVVQGLEIDGRWLILDSLTAYYGLSYLDFNYEEFKNGNCYAGQTPDGVDLDSDGNLDTCDYTGERGVYSPKYTFNLSLDYRQSITSSMDFISTMDWQYVDSQQVHVNLDPSGEIGSHNMLGLRLAIDTNNWSLAILGKNLLNEYIINYSGIAPVSDSRFNTNTHYSFILPPRTVALEATLKL